MTTSVKPQQGRLILMIIVVGSALGAFLALAYAGRDGGIIWDTVKSVMNDLLGIYLPLIAMMSAFYFGEAKPLPERASEPVQTFLFTLITAGVWVLLPPVLILFGGAIEGVQETLTLLKPYGETIAAAGIGYYFARSAISGANGA
ncbi:MAG: hypothetical protein N838_11430 [Thiohalocapsa sp. PB-PSB1]|nr:MAG: hypothetical protein N838_11430 [Thiohalocapsa sp. PB-PSB1]